MDDQTQRSQALDTTRSFLIQAPAGSGKTELLTQRYLKLLSISESPESVLAMTFTKKAVSELKARVIGALKSATDKRPEQAHKQITYDLALAVLEQSKVNSWDLINMPQRLKISTIDGLSNLITSRYPQPQNWVNKQIITQIWQQDNLYLQAAKQTLLSIDDKDFGTCISSTLLYLDNNVNRFYQLVTSMLKKRDQWLNKLYLQDTLNIQNLENSAATIINRHLEQLSNQAQQHFNTEFFTALSGNTQPEISSLNELPCASVNDLPKWKSLANLCLTAAGDCRKQLTKANGFPADVKIQKQTVLETLTDLSGQTALCALLRDVNKLPDVNFDTAQIQVLDDIAQVLKIAVAQLNILFNEQQVTDFIQVALDADQALSQNETSDIALFLDYKIQHLLIDEFQDTSSTQFSLIEKLITNWQPDDNKTLFLVGDPMQSIYLFRQSQVGLFLQVRAQGIANISPEFLQLTTNFRSTKAVVEANNEIFSKIFPQQEDAYLGAISYSPSIAANQNNEPAIQMHPCAYKEDQQEAQIVLDIIQNNPDKQIAVLVRSRSHFKYIAPALKNAGIEFESLKTTPLKEALFSKDLLSLTRALLHLGDKTAWLSLLRSPWCGLLLEDLLALSQNDEQVILEVITSKQGLKNLSADGQKRAQHIAGALEQAIGQRARFSFVQTLEFALYQLMPKSSLSVKESMIKDQFMKIIHECELQQQLNITTINQMLAELYASSVRARVQLMTIHESKGLEFDWVIMPGLGKSSKSNQSPIIHLQESIDQSLLLAPMKSYVQSKDSATYDYLKYVESQQNNNETLRLLYVAMTRAKQSVHLLGTLNKSNKAGKNTLLSLLATKFQHQFDQVTPTTIEADQVLVKAPELLRYKQLPDYQLLEDHAHEKIDFGLSVEVQFKSLMGTLLHQYFEQEQFSIDQASIKLRLIEAGFAQHQLDQQLAIVMHMIQNTQSDPQFEWLFKVRESTQVEAEFVVDGHSIIIDRYFIDNSILWIIDFKTAGQAEHESIEQFVQRQKLAHTKQLLFYKEVLSKIYKYEIKCALYCPSVQKIIEIDSKI